MSSDLDLDPAVDDLEIEPERYELTEAPPYRFDVSRRAFLQWVGAGVLFTTAEGLAPVVEGQTRRPAAPSGGGRTLGARLHLGEDGTFTVMTSKVEVGQGSRTQLAQAAAEELRVKADSIRLIMADTDAVPNDGGTFGSLTTPRTVPAVRKAAVTARKVLVEMARDRWKLTGDGSELEVKDGKVIHPRGGESLSYADLAKSPDLGTAFARSIPDEVALTQVEDWKVLGVSAPKTGGREMVTGAHRYPSDIVRPNMLYGKVLRPPSYGATLTAVDLSPAEEGAGVTAVHDGNFVGCAADTSQKAREAVEAVSRTARWQTSSHPPSRQLFAYLKEHAHTGESGTRRPRVRTQGSLEEGLAKAAQVARASYEVAYVQHAPMEPRAAVAEWDGDRLTVWTGTQRPNGVKAELARAFKISSDQVRVIVPDTGGGFGGKHTGECAVEAARLARAARRPVSLTWTRREELTWAYFRPAGLIEVQGGLSEGGQLVAWDFSNYNSGASALTSPYDVPHSRASFFFCDSPLREGSYRALAATANTFARESFMDELAVLAHADPLEFRLAHLKQAQNRRLRAVLEQAAEAFQWRRRRQNPKPGTGIGLACGTEKGSYTAVCCEVGVDGGKIRVHEICQSFECGAIHNPSNLQAQIEGCLVMTLGGTLSEEIRFEDGRIENASFAGYQVPRFRDLPAKMEILLLDRPDLPSVGAGETPMIAAPGAMGNAVHDAAGVRIRSLPLRLENPAQA